MTAKPQGPGPSSVPIETLSRVAASIAHRITDPLSVIIGNAQYILLQLEEKRAKAGAPNGELIDGVQTILREGTRLTGLMNELLGLSSRLDSKDTPARDGLTEIERFLDEGEHGPPQT